MQEEPEVPFDTLTNRTNATTAPASTPAQQAAWEKEEKPAAVKLELHLAKACAELVAANGGSTENATSCAVQRRGERKEDYEVEETRLSKLCRAQDDPSERTDWRLPKSLRQMFFWL